MQVIYALIDPRDGTTRYIGLTDDVYARFSHHLRCDGSNPRKDAWVRELKAAHEIVIMKTLEKMDDRNMALMREAYWIAHYHYLGAFLYNRSYPRPPTRTSGKMGKQPESITEDDLERALALWQDGAKSDQALSEAMQVTKYRANVLHRRMRAMGLLNEGKEEPVS
jgi:predicted GIY-YIG superfamily endonuclease